MIVLPSERTLSTNPVPNDIEIAAPGAELAPERFDAMVFDLDGVITRTAKVHAAAWKRMFDDYLAKHTAPGEPCQPFDIESDYLNYVDGKPRYDGVRSFLDARGIELPAGEPQDGPDQETISGLGNRKDRFFMETLRSDGVEVYTSTIDLIRVLREAGKRIGVVSSSRNCQAVLEAAGISALFDARVDGRDLQQLGIPGKPAPDMFLEACRRLDREPQRSIGVEDAMVGVQAAKAAGYGCVIGVNRGDVADGLREHGADLVVRDLAEIHLAGGAPAQQLPSALDRIDEIMPGDNQELAIFLDYDGTLTPIVARPKDAVLSDNMRQALERLCRLSECAIISGRDLADVRERVGIRNIWYAGSHGFDIAGPDNERAEYQEGGEYLPTLDRAEQMLKEKLSAVPNCQVERKRFSIATHYRQVDDADVETVRQAVEATQAATTGLRLSSGKKIFELQPDIEWDKGKALLWLMQTLDMDPGRFVPLYIGDDVTDEDVFRELGTAGVGILVAPESRPTGASYRLDDPDAVEQFLKRLGDRLDSSSA
ncbi:MAG: trehalose-phosphatase [Thiogranum sp.]|nr:trehalose-phosphatase [Thiogranum sp.]